MKKQISILLFALMFATGLAGQVVTTTSINSGLFYNTVSFMSDSSSELYQDHTSGPLESIMFTTNLFTGGTFYADNDSKYFDEPSTSLGANLYFTRIDTNIEGFEANGTANIGFFGNESADRNKLLIKGYDGSGNEIQSKCLFDYRSSASSSNTPAPSAYTISPDSNAPAGSYYSYSHENPIKGLSEQKNTSRFAMFQSYDPLTLELNNEWIFAIDDRETGLVDYDDGFFYITGDITPVPEPSGIALIAAVALVGVISLNYRKKNRSKN